MGVYICVIKCIVCQSVEMWSLKLRIYLLNYLHVHMYYVCIIYIYMYALLFVDYVYICMYACMKTFATVAV